MKSPSGHVWSRCRERGRRARAEAGEVVLRQNDSVSMSNGERNVGEKRKRVRGVLFYVIGSVFLLSKTHPMRDAKCWGAQDTPLTPIGQAWSLPTNRRQGVDPVTGSASCGLLGWAPGTRQKLGVSGVVGGNPVQRR